MYGKIISENDGIQSKTFSLPTNFNRKTSGVTSLEFKFYDMNGPLQRQKLTMTGVATQLPMTDWVPLKYAKKQVPSDMLERTIRDAYKKNARFMTVIADNQQFAETTTRIAKTLRDEAHNQVTQQEIRRFNEAKDALYKPTARGVCYRQCVNSYKDEPSLGNCLKHCKNVFIGEESNESLTVRYRQIELQSVIEHAQVQAMLLANHNSNSEELQSDIIIMLPQRKETMDQLAHMGIVPNPIGL